MEAASKKMGRPRVIPENVVAVVEMCATPGSTERTKQNVFYRQYAISLL